MAKPTQEAPSKHATQEKRALSEKIGALWDWVLDASLVLWICRVSLVSAVVGLVLFLLVPQARDTFLEVRGPGIYYWRNALFWAIFFFFVIFFWALPVHYCARRDLNFDPINTNDRRKLPRERAVRVHEASELVPRILGAACLFAVAAGAFLASSGLRAKSLPHLSDQAHLQSYILGGVALLLMVGLFLFFSKRDNLTLKLGTKGITLDPHFGRNVLITLTIIFFALLLLPIDAVENLSRAPLIPLLLGGWVPFLAWLALKGRIYRAPFIVLLFVALELFTIAGNNHDIRTLTVDSRARPIVDDDGNYLKRASEQSKTGAIRERLDQKIADWTRAVCGHSQQCNVRPIIVAASGGASRAGFFTGAVLGELTDISLADPKHYRDFRKQLFAISSVSGSSTGAAFYIASLLDAKEGASPCSGTHAPLAYFEDAPTTWRKCMETMLSGDFISATLFAYIYKDALRGPAALASRLGYDAPDRAVVLEKSWEKQYCAYTKNICTDAPSGLSRPFLSVAGVEGQTPKEWVPLLFLNTTDVDTGRRVIISSIGPKTCPQGATACRPEDRVRVFPDAYDLHELLADRPGDEGRNNANSGVLLEGTTTEPVSFLQEDVRLSTAAGLSARFPFVSPPGNVKNKNGGLVARIVDGGYFENFGAATALDLANRLREANLDPLIIEITNDPELLGPLTLKPNETGDRGKKCVFTGHPDPVCATEPPVIETSESYVFSGVRGPLSGLFGARAAQGGRTLDELANSANTGALRRNGCPPNPVDRHFAHIFVEPQYDYSSFSSTCKMVDVSMSWWLSKPVQAYLDEQITDEIWRATKFMELTDQPTQHP